MVNLIACFALSLVTGVLLVVVGRRRGENWEKIAVNCATFALLPCLSGLAWFLPGSQGFVWAALVALGVIAVVMIFVRWRSQ
jgi:peptidoglycan/LPS O-acetylase OafA/YrhL